MGFKIYYEENIYNLDEQRGKGKIYDIISKSKPTPVKKLFSKKSYAHVPSGTYEFYIDGYNLYLTYILREIEFLFEFLDNIITQNPTLLWTINYEGPCSYVIALQMDNKNVRLVFLDRPEPNCRDWQNRYKDDELKHTIVVKDIIISKYELIKQFNDEFKRIYSENKYYISEKYKKESNKKGAVLYQEYVLNTFKEYIPIFDKYLEKGESYVRIWFKWF